LRQAPGRNLRNSAIARLFWRRGLAAAYPKVLNIASFERPQLALRVQSVFHDTGEIGVGKKKLIN
jgi:hypothetical protein